MGDVEHEVKRVVEVKSRKILNPDQLRRAAETALRRHPRILAGQVLQEIGLHIPEAAGADIDWLYRHGCRPQTCPQVGDEFYVRYGLPCGIDVVCRAEVVHYESRSWAWSYNGPVGGKDQWTLRIKGVVEVEQPEDFYEPYGYDIYGHYHA